MKLIRPIKKSYVVTFSYNEHVAYENENNLGNTYRPGIDYVSYYSDGSGDVPIYCADSGIINKTGYDESGYGNYIKIKHDWGYSLYAHMKYSPILSIGTVVDSSTTLGYQGHTGNCRDTNGNNTEAASHLHFETRDLKENNFDPTQYIVDREEYIEENITDSEVNTAEDSIDNSIHVGSIVYIKDGAKSYTGQELWSGVFGNSYSVDEIYENRVLLDKNGICTPVDINDIYLQGNESNNQTDSDNESVYYTIQAGDNLWNIAQKYNTTIDAILKLNPKIVNSNLIYIDEVIKIK